MPLNSGKLSANACPQKDDPIGIRCLITGQRDFIDINCYGSLFIYTKSVGTILKVFAELFQRSVGLLRPFRQRELEIFPARLAEGRSLSTDRFVV